MTRVHYTSEYITNPQHKVTVALIGAGGTGSQVLSGLARMNEALIAFGHPGIHVYLYDADIITEANVGRQLFSPADVGMNKAVCLVSRINRYFGYDWVAYPEMWSRECERVNITISCVDNNESRLSIVDNANLYNGHPINKSYYWMDFGNGQKTGQVILGSWSNIKQPKSSKYKLVAKLPTVVEHFKNFKNVVEEESGPSCSLAEALHKQDLYINSTLANLGLSLLWKLMRDGFVVHRGLYLNLETMAVNPIKL